MRADEPDEDKFGSVFRGLEEMARRIEARRYPGRAWGDRPSRSRGPVLWKIAAAAGALAAGIALAVHFWPAGGAATPPVQHVQQATGPQPAPLAMPRILVLEDADSYSIIDLHGSVPVVCFASRRSTGFEFITPIFGAQPPAAATRNSHL